MPTFIQNIKKKMRHCRGQKAEAIIVERKGLPPLIKHEDFTGTMDDLNAMISSDEKNEREVIEYVKRKQKWIELKIE